MPAMLIIVALFVLVFAIRSYTDEVRHGSIVPTFLATPNRLWVLAAKGVVAAAGAGRRVRDRGARGGDRHDRLVPRGARVRRVRRDRDAWPGCSAGRILIAMLWSAIGLSIGVMVRHQVAAIVGTLAWLFVAENIVGSLAPQHRTLVAGLGRRDRCRASRTRTR